MYVKIKMEQQSLKELSPMKNLNNFPVDGDETVISLKKKIEQVVKVPAENQEIRTLHQSFSNSQTIKDISYFKGVHSIMLYRNSPYEDYNNSQFVCFLQFFEDRVALEQHAVEQRTSTPCAMRTSNNSSSSSTLIADSDSEDSSSEGDSDSGSSNSEDSSSGNSGEDGKKRPKHFTDNKNHKKLKCAPTVVSNLSPSVYKYFDDFPGHSQEFDDHNYKSLTTATPPTKCNNMSHEKREERQGEIPSNKTTIVATNDPGEAQSNVTSTNIDVCHPCRVINPENRKYTVIVSKNDGGIDKIHCEKLLEWFFDRFRSCKTFDQLEFENNDPVTIFEGKLWIACMNKPTFEWVCSSLSLYPIESFKIESLSKDNEMVEVIIPLVGQKNNLLDIFHVLEEQNKNLCTLRWSVEKRKILQAEDKQHDALRASKFFTNELICISVDATSKKLLEKVNMKLKYCFWQIVFNSINI